MACPPHLDSDASVDFEQFPYPARLDFTFDFTQLVTSAESFNPPRTVGPAGPLPGDLERAYYNPRIRIKALFPERPTPGSGKRRASKGDKPKVPEHWY